MNLADLLSERAAEAPDSLAVLYDEETIGIGRMEAAAWTIAARLRDHGLKPGDVVGLLMRDPLLHLVASSRWRATASCICHCSRALRPSTMRQF